MYVYNYELFFVLFIEFYFINDNNERILGYECSNFERYLFFM